MIPAAALTETLTVYTRSDAADDPLTLTVDESVDRYGNPVRAETDEGDFRAAVWPLDATEDELNRDTRTSRYRALVEPTVPVDGLAPVEWRGRTYEIVGDPEIFTAPTGVHHYEMILREHRG